MTQEQRQQWQLQVATAIINPAAIPTADKLRLLCEWPILRAWAQSVLKRNPDKVPAKTVDAYLRDALAWSGHLGDPTALLAAPSVNDATVNVKSEKHLNDRPDYDGSNEHAIVRSINDVKADAGGTISGEKILKEPIPERPTHFDQYRHLVPDELGEQFDTEITELYLLRSELGAKRDHIADLVEQAMYAGEEAVEDQYSAQLSEVAQQLVNAETTLLHFWALVDVAYRYYQLNGEIMPIEDLRQEVGTIPPSSKRQRAPRTPDYTKAEVEAMTDPDEQALQKAERIRKNGNFLRDKRKADNARANGGEAYDKWCVQILLRAKEMEEWGETLTAVQQEIVASATCSE